jgi:hypothetical protein
MKPEANRDKLIWDFVDGMCNAADKERVEKLIREDPSWRYAYEEIASLQRLLKSGELEQPSLRFVQNTMEAIAREQLAPSTKKYLNHTIIYGIGFLFLVSIGGLLLYGMNMIDWTATSGSGGSNLPNIKVPSLDYSKYFNPKILKWILIGDILLALWLVDGLIRREKMKPVMH